MDNHINHNCTLILPVRKGGAQLRKCLKAITAGTVVPEIVIMDCTSEKGALDPIRNRFPSVRVFDMGMNPGRAHAVNTGIHITKTPYVCVLAPRILVGRHCIERMLAAMEKNKNLMSVQAKILASEDPERISGAGWNLSADAASFVRGQGAKAFHYRKRAMVLAAQLDACLFRMETLETVGILDERFYSRLEDLDLGYRGCMAGFDNLYEPSAVCREMESERSSDFYRQMEIGNQIYFRYKHGLGDPGKALRSLLHRKDPGYETAVQRGAMLCFQAEMEMMERTELAMTVTKQTLPEEFCMEVKDEAVRKVFPLYLGERSEASPADIPDLLKMRLRMAVGTADRIRNLLR